MTAERDDLLTALAIRRNFLRYTVRDLTDEQAAMRPTRSELCLGGLIKHCMSVEEDWLRFAAGGADAMSDDDEEAWANEFRMNEGETLNGLLDQYTRVADRTTELVNTLDLDTSHELPRKPWFEQGARWTVRRVLLHVLCETAQHAGHADILRESIDGAKTMG
ncbi:MAG TPA: DinB family protein [Pseudonocardiaceae bacterium]|nr:DinB family protein [Pseudonocardiaceae bacterium]